MKLIPTHTPFSLIVVTLLIISVLSLPAFAGEQINTDKTGLALDGYDPVAYFNAGEPQKGDFTISAIHEETTYWFVNEESKATFEASPERYLPQYGGYCAFGVAIGKKFNGDPLVWTIIDGKLYLNLHVNIAEKFNEDTVGYIASADENWPTIDDVPAVEIK